MLKSIKEKMNIHSMKNATKKLQVRTIKDSEFLYVPLNQNIGKPSSEMVSVGDRVKRYQKIGDKQGGFSSSVHSPVSGVVTEIKEVMQANGMAAKTVVIKNDFLYEEAEVSKRNRTEIDNISNEEIFNIVEDAGIVGAGGAQCPTYIKYDIKDKIIDTLILNGTECEPYLTSDYSLLRDYTNDFLDGVKLLKKLLNPKEIVLAIENENKELAEKFNKIDFLKLVILPTEYPQGSEKHLIKKITNKEIKGNQLPIDLGVVVSNVGTVKAVFDAVIEGKPQVERIITISGELSSTQGNYIVKNGTPLSHIIKNVEPKESLSNVRFIYGGPMMGREITDYMTPTIKGTSGILYLSKEIDNVERKNCIYCGSCSEVCPMKLMPMHFAKVHSKGDYSKLGELSIMSCVECAACEYICPSRVPLIESIKIGKQKFREMEAKKNEK